MEGKPSCPLIDKYVRKELAKQEQQVKWSGGEERGLSNDNFLSLST